jgi:short subunit dehydrogenase-like uncharacterized protein
MPDRDYDVVLYGASGFTGRQTVRYFAERTRPGEVRWAIAGRSREKLEEVKTQIGGAAADVDVLVADALNQAAVDAVVSRTRVMLATAGPFALYGNGIVDACARFKTHYADITGETTWVSDLIERHHERAASDSTRIVPFCGFDSVPSDLGAFLVARHIREELGVECKKVKASYQVMGGVNGGTLATVFNVYESDLAKRARDPFLLSPGVAHSEDEIERSRDPALPHYDEDFNAWVGPFFMGPVNTRVVRRSSDLFAQWGSPYGTEFSYQEFMKFGGSLGLAKAAGLTAGAALFEVALQSPLRNLVKSIAPKPGTGPSEKTMDEGWFRCDLVGLASNGRKVRGLIRDQGDPGNRATVKFLCESALALALNAGELPGGESRGGVLTPATALGDVLVKRLRDAGMRIEIANK